MSELVKQIAALEDSFKALEAKTLKWYVDTRDEKFRDFFDIKVIRNVKDLYDQSPEP